MSPRDLVDEAIAAGYLEEAPADLRVRAKPSVVTEQTVGYYGEIVVNAMSADRGALDEWIQDWFIRWHPDGYSSYSDGIVETAQGFVVTVHRWGSSE